MNKRDFAIIAIILLVAVAFYAFSGHKKGDTVSIYQGDKLYGKYPLNTDTEIDIDGKNTVRIENGQAYMYYADCPDKLCVHQGKTSSKNKSIICLPNRIVVRIDKESDIDVVAGEAK